MSTRRGSSATQQGRTNRKAFWVNDYKKKGFKNVTANDGPTYTHTMGTNQNGQTVVVKSAVQKANIWESNSNHNAPGGISHQTSPVYCYEITFS